jgi:hypothetical protein
MLLVLFVLFVVQNGVKGSPGGGCLKPIPGVPFGYGRRRVFHVHGRPLPHPRGQPRKSPDAVTSVLPQ